MKIGPAAADRFIAAPPEGLKACLLYGPDGGLVRERARSLARVRVPDLDDPFRVSLLAGGTLGDDPAALADEAALLSLTGETRVVRVEDAGDGATAAVENLLARPAGDSLVIMEAGELPPRSRLRKLFEDSPDAAAIPCYADDQATLDRLIRQTVEEAGLAISADAVAFLGEHLGADRQITRSELEKLVLYAKDSGAISLEDAALCCGDNAILTLDDLCDAVTTGDVAAVVAGLDRLLEEGVNAITILRALQRHLQRLQLTAARIAAGTAPDQAIKGLRPPLFFKRTAPFRKSLQYWNTERAALGLDRLFEAETTCKSGIAPPDPVCAATLIALARAPSVHSQRTRD